VTKKYVDDNITKMLICVAIRKATEWIGICGKVSISHAIK